jgi:hypothetical protein
MASVPVLMPRLSPRARRGRIDRLRWAAGACFRSHGLRVGVRVNRPDLLPRLLERLPPGVRPAASPVVDRIFSLWATDGAPARVYAGGARRARTPDLDEALAVLESEIRQGIAAAAPRRTFVHAGAVGWRGRAILVPGRSRSGKTTLVAALVRAGASYLSDEYAVIDDRGRVHPFAKPLSVRGPTGCDRHAARVPAAALGGRVASRPMPVGVVALTTHRPGAAWAPARVTRGQAVLEMLRHTAPARLRPEAVLSALDAATSGALLLAGERGEADEAARALLRALDDEVEKATPRRARAAGGGAR